MSITNTQKLIKFASQELRRWEELNAIVAEDQRKFYDALSQGICPTCGIKLKVIEHTDDENGFNYQYKCGHGFRGLTIQDNVTAHESLGIKQKRKGVGLLKKTFSGYRPSIDPNLEEGVFIDMTVDVENDQYSQKVVDNKTGQILHEENEPLTEHSRKQKLRISKKL